MVAVGFMFGIVANLSSMAPSGQPGQGEQPQEINAELPSDTYSEQDYGLGVNEQIFLSRNHEVVFVTALYEDSATEFDLQGLDEEFNGRVYINKVEASESTLNQELEIDQYPEIVVVGDQPTQEAGFTLRQVENDRDAVKSAICEAMRNVGDSAATCF